MTAAWIFVGLVILAVLVFGFLDWYLSRPFKHARPDLWARNRAAIHAEGQRWLEDEADYDASP